MRDMDGPPAPPQQVRTIDYYIYNQGRKTPDGWEVAMRRISVPRRSAPRPSSASVLVSRPNVDAGAVPRNGVR